MKAVDQYGAGKSLEVIEKVRQITGVVSADACRGRPEIFSLVEMDPDSPVQTNTAGREPPAKPTAQQELKTQFVLKFTKKEN